MFGIVHYGGGGDKPACGNDSWLAVYTDESEEVTGCSDCLEMSRVEPATQKAVTASGKESEAEEEIAGPRIRIMPPVVRKVSTSGIRIMPQEVRRVSLGNIVRE